MKIYKVEFKGMYPVGNCLIIAAPDIYVATEMAKKQIRHTDEIEVFEVDISKPCVIEYLSGDY